MSGMTTWRFGVYQLPVVCYKHIEFTIHFSA